MRAVREFKVRIEIPVDKLFIKNDNRDREIVEELYLKKCFRNSYIHNILDVQSCSTVEIPIYNTRGKGTKTVNIIAECDTYPMGKILVGCRLKPKKSEVSSINMVKDHIDIFTNANSFLVPFNERHMVNVMVKVAEYASFSKRVVVGGAFYLYPGNSKTFIITDNLKEESKSAILQRVKDNEDLLKEVSDNKNYKFFYNLVYPYKIIKEVGEPITNLLNKDTMNLVVDKPNTIHCVSNKFSYSSSDIQTKITADKFIDYILSTQFEHIMMVKNMIEVYKIDDENNSLLWKLYADKKSD
jgi:hypothetical protein